MLEPVVQFFTRIFEAIGRGLGRFVAVLLWPFVALSRWYTRRGWMLRGILGALVAALFAFYFHFAWQTQAWTSFNPDYVNAYKLDDEAAKAEAAAAASAKATTQPVACKRSEIVAVTADLVDFNVNQTAWITSKLAYKSGLFGLAWDATPFLDNKASFQRGVHQAIKRTAVELYDTLGRARGTSAADPDLERARGSLQYRDDVWYISLGGGWFPRPIATTPSSFRDGLAALRKFNDRLSKCQATFDARADNLTTFMDRIAKDIGSTTAQLKERAESSNYGWFDTRADNLYWQSYGELYAYLGILKAANVDFAATINSRQLTKIWNDMEDQVRSALKIQPFIVSNGSEDGWIMPTHLTTMGFYILRVRANMTEIRDTLQQ